MLKYAINILLLDISWWTGKGASTVTIGIGHVITVVVAFFTVGAIIIIAIWNAHRGTHSEADERIKELEKNLAKLRERIVRIDGYLGHNADQHEKQKQEFWERLKEESWRIQKQESLEIMESQNKKEEQNGGLDG